MGNLSVEIGANTSKLVSEIGRAKTSLQNFIGEMADAADAGEKLTDVSDEQVQSFQKVIAKLEKITEGTMTTKKEQKALRDSIQELRDQWSELGNEARSSEFGRAMADTMRAANDELNALKQNMASVGDINISTGSLKKDLRANTNELVNLTAQYRAMSDAERASASGQELARKMSEIRAKAGELKDTIGDVNDEIKVMASDTPNLDAFNAALGIGADLMSTYSSIVAKLTGDDKALKDAIATVMVVQSAANLVTKVTNNLQSSSVIMLKVRSIQERAAATAINIKTAAEGKGVITTKAATVAQKAFNAVARANPYVLLATAILAVGSALVMFTTRTKEATEQEKRLQEEANKTKAAMEKQHNENERLGNKTGELVGKFKVLQAQWKALKTEGEKKKFIEDNQSAFSALGVAVNNVNDAYSVFVKNADKVIAALKAIAEAEAFQELYKESIKKQAKWGHRDKSSATGDYYKPVSSEEKKPVSAYGGVPDEWNKAGLKPKEDFKSNYDEFNPTIELTQKGIDKLNKYRNDQALKTRKNIEKGYQEETDYYEKLYIDAVKKAEEAKHELAEIGGKPKPTGGSGGSGGSKKDEPKYVKGSLSDLEAQLQKIEKDYKDGLIPITKKDEYEKTVKELQQKIKNKKLEMGLEVKIPENSLKAIEEQLKAKQIEFEFAEDKASRDKIEREIKELTAKKNTIEIIYKVNVKAGDLDAVKISQNEHNYSMYDRSREDTSVPTGTKSEKKAQAAEKEVSYLREELDFNRRIEESLVNQYKDIQAKLQLGGELTADEKELAGIYEKTRDAVIELSKAYEQAAESARQLKLDAEIKKKTWDGIKGGINTIGDLNSATRSTYDNWKYLGEQWNKMNSFERVTSAIDATINTINALISSYESVNKMIKLFGEISELTAAKKIAANSATMASDEAQTAAETANTQVKVQNDQVEMQSEIGKLGVKEAGAIAGATSSGASLPYPANLIAIATGVALVLSMFATVFSCFAQGGIVGGGSYVGDNQIVRVNSGEMILNGTQQKRLFDLLNGSGNFGNSNTIGGEVKFVIKGNDLEGVLKNYNKKLSRV